MADPDLELGGGGGGLDLLAMAATGLALEPIKFPGGNYHLKRVGMLIEKL